MKTHLLLSLSFILFLFLTISFPHLINSKFINNLYHSNKELYNSIDNLLNSPQCSGVISKNTINDGENLSKFLIYYTIQSKTPSLYQKTAFMIFGEHSRELISPEQALFLIKVLCKQIPEYTSETVDEILNRIKFIIIPVVNEYGRDLVQSGAKCQRTNINGVDLNRNWDSHWEYTPTHDEMFPGDKPFSEWETRSMKRLISQTRPEIFITTHSGTLGLYSPFAYKKVNFDLLDRNNSKRIATMLKVLKQVNKKYCNCKTGAAGNELWYLCPGTCLDYAYEQMGVKYTFAFEIYDGTSSNPFFWKILNDDNLKTFNYKEFIEKNKIDDESNGFKILLQEHMKMDTEGKDNLSSGNKFLQIKKNENVGKNLFSYDKIQYHEEMTSLSMSCFTQTGMSLKMNEGNKNLGKKGLSTMKSKILLQMQLKMNMKNKLQNKLITKNDEDECNNFYPLNEKHFKNTLINWVNVYFELFALITEYDNGVDDIFKDLQLDLI